jgi:predicted dienelactone hydrolase
LRALRVLSSGLALLVAGLLSAYGLTRPTGPAELSTSAERLRPGPHAVGSVDRTLVDGSRPTPAHGDFSGASSRTLETTLWFPLDAGGAHPLLVYSHGFMSMRSEAVLVAEHLASHGTVVISADYPATNFRAPGGPNIADAVSQPGDVSFLLDTVTGWGEAERPFRGTIDPRRIGAAGLSLGGFTTTLAAFHPTLRDARISAAVSIAGPSAMFARRFFATARVPFLMIAGDADAIVDYAANAAPIPSKLAHGGALLTLAGGSHTGFSPMADGLMRVFGNPDRIGCAALSRTLKLTPREDPFVGLGSEEQGVLAQIEQPLPCANGAPRRALAAGRQLMITRLALRAFLESVWESDPTRRAASAHFLAETLARDFSEVRYQGIAPLPPSRVLELREAPRRPGAPAADLVAAPAPLEAGALGLGSREPAIAPALDVRLP